MQQRMIVSNVVVFMMIFLCFTAPFTSLPTAAHYQVCTSKPARKLAGYREMLPTEAINAASS
jgi:hypothetical protein